MDDDDLRAHMAVHDLDTKFTPRGKPVMSKFPVSRFLDYLDRLSVGRSSKYLALRQSLVGMVEDGYLAAGERLPPNRN